MSCVTTVRYAVKFNGTILSTFAPSRGLCQGDPLSPFLFLLVADGLSLLLEEKVRLGAITPVKVCRGAPSISHLLFADNTLLFFKAKREEAVVIKEVLECYADGTDQLINPGKCSIMFGDISDLSIRQEISSVLQVANSDFDDKYLGFPTPQGRMHKGKFQNLNERIWKRTMLWGKKFLSAGGKEILIKAVLQSIPVYVMSLFKLPGSVCNDLVKAIRNFWWGADNGKRKTHWRGQEDDFVAWHLDKWSCFSVRSAYHLALSLKNMDQAESSSDVNLRRSWGLLWKCNVPQKVKIFSGKAANNCLATSENKKKRKLEQVDVCGWILDHLGSLEEERNMFLMLLWRIWEACGTSSQAAMGHRKQEVTDIPWTKPGMGWMKLNVDGSYDATVGTGGIGAILRNSSGEVIFSACDSIDE
uniref:Retrotransposon protein, putative, unclassified n=2 Tax=Oryza sativa TaxID=4530 RepID=Q2QQT9_ORYSJ|nr:retrotransposon protein, putative, unclassified [Oryza sativa Japonica Group]